MNEQEMQFADPEWKPMAGKSLQDEDGSAQSSLSRVRKNQTYNSNQSANTFSSYEQGYQGGQRQLPPIPYIAPVSPQTQTRPTPAPRRRSRLWIWVIIIIAAIYMFGGMSSFRSNNYSTPPYQGVPSYNSHVSSYNLADISRLQIDDESGSIQVQVGDSSKDEVTVSSADDNVTATDGKGLMSISIHGDATITLPSNIAASLALTANGGDIVVSNYQGKLSAENSDYSIFLNNSQITGQSVIHSGSGEIHVNQSSISGTVALTSDSGNITLDHADLNGDVTVSTGKDGNVYFTGTLDQSGKYHFSTENGNMDLALPADTSLHVNVSKGEHGYYQNDFDKGSNGSTTLPISVDVKTDSGTITIHPR